MLRRHWTGENGPAIENFSLLVCLAMAFGSRKETAGTLDWTRSTVKRDVVASFLISLIALPLCLGISLASGFPPFAGLITAIIGGLVATFFGSAPLTIKGPAAGLAPIALACVTPLGYEKALAVVVVAAAIQIAFALARTSIVSEVFPLAVVKGMLAAIGVILISKQTYVLVGLKSKSPSILGSLADLPQALAHPHVQAAIIGLTCWALLLTWPRLTKFAAPLRNLPAPLVAVVVGILLARHFDWQHGDQATRSLLLQVPESLLDAVAFPDFSAILSHDSLLYIAMFAIVGSVESVLSAKAVDVLDPEMRRSNLDKDLLATGVANLLAGFLGGLPMISEIARSSANVAAGARTSLANFIHGACLLLFVVAVPDLMRQIPLAALAAILVVTGMRLASPQALLGLLKKGKVPAMVFLVTIAVTLAEDLLLGVVAGLVVDVLVHWLRGTAPWNLIRPCVDVDESGRECVVYLRGAATLFALPKLTKVLAKADGDRPVVVSLSTSTRVDVSLHDRLHEIEREWQRNGRALRIDEARAGMLS